jgi:hypothetical protein
MEFAKIHETNPRHNNHSKRRMTMTEKQQREAWGHIQEFIEQELDKRRDSNLVEYIAEAEAALRCSQELYAISGLAS